MKKLQNKGLTANAKTLRKHMTREERHLWYDFFKQLPLTVNRQKVIGPYIVDFYCAEAKLVIELDGSQHYEDHGKASDAERDAYLRQQGLSVVRYSNFEIHTQFEAVCQDLYQRLPLEGKLSVKE